MTGCHATFKVTRGSLPGSILVVWNPVFRVLMVLWVGLRTNSPRASVWEHGTLGRELIRHAVHMPTPCVETIS